MQLREFVKRQPLPGFQTVGTARKFELSPLTRNLEQARKSNKTFVGLWSNRHCFVYLAGERKGSLIYVYILFMQACQGWSDDGVNFSFL